MKKAKSLLLAVPFAICSAITLAACGPAEPPHTHSLTKIEAVEATCITAGNTQYYACADCEKYYLDDKAETELSVDSLTIPALGHSFTDDSDYTCDRNCGHIRETSSYNIWDGSKEALPSPIDNVYTITTAEQLATLADMVNTGNHFEDIVFNLEVDIDLQNKSWTSIGYGTDVFDAYFSGTFDGNGHTIKNLNVTGFGGGMTYDDDLKKEVPTNGVDGTSGVGLFGAVNGGTIKDLNIDTAVVNGNHFVGALVGWAINTDIDECSVINAQVTCSYYDEEESGDKAGSIAGSIDHNSLMTNCWVSNSTVQAGRDAGQLVGCASINRADFAQTNYIEGTVSVTYAGVGANTNIKNDLIGRLSGPYV